MIGIAFMLPIWNHCTDRGVYVLTEKTIDALLGHRGAAAELVYADLGEIVDGGIRIKGAQGRIEWLTKCRDNAVKAGRARAKGAPRMPDGSFTPAERPSGVQRPMAGVQRPLVGRTSASQPCEEQEQEQEQESDVDVGSEKICAVTDRPKTGRLDRGGGNGKCTVPDDDVPF
jgi:hypothetical protein